MSIRIESKAFISVLGNSPTMYLPSHTHCLYHGRHYPRLVLYTIIMILIGIIIHSSKIQPQSN